jgi:predicted kinase
MPKLIVLRGNSGSGKSTVAKKIRELSARKTAIVEQDYLRRIVLKEDTRPNGDNIKLIQLVTEFALQHGYDVILEGIMNFTKHGHLLRELANHWPEHYFFYFDIPLEETFKRHAMKPNAHEFGNEEMTEWYHPKDFTGFAGEITIPESSSFDETVQTIMRAAGL